MDCTKPENISEVVASHQRDINHVLGVDLDPIARQMADAWVLGKQKQIEELNGQAKTL